MPELLRPRRFESVADVCDLAVGLVRDAGWGEADVTRVALAMGEAVANAVEHGGGDHVRLEVDADPRRLTVRIDEGGPGPDADRLDHAALPEDPLATCGRGLFILQQVTDEVEVEETGALRFVIRARV